MLKTFSNVHKTYKHMSQQRAKDYFNEAGGGGSHKLAERKSENFFVCACGGGPL